MQIKSNPTNEATELAKIIFFNYANTKMLALLYLVSHVTDCKFETEQSALIGAAPTYIPDTKDTSHITVIYINGYHSLKCYLLSQCIIPFNTSDIKHNTLETALYTCQSTNL